MQRLSHPVRVKHTITGLKGPRSINWARRVSAGENHFKSFDVSAHKSEDLDTEAAIKAIKTFETQIR